MKEIQLADNKEVVVSLKSIIKSIPHATSICSWTDLEIEKLRKLKELRLKAHRMTSF